MSDVIKNYISYVIFEKNAVGVLPHGVHCPTLSYAYVKPDGCHVGIITTFRFYCLKMCSSPLPSDRSQAIII